MKAKTLRTRLAHLIVRVSALLAPRALRARWREEWLAELDAADERRRPSFVRRALGAPFDAVLLRAAAIGAAARATRAGWHTDLRQTWRGLLRSPRHVATVVICIGIGITVSVAVFSIVNSLLYGDIPGIEQRKALLRVFISHENAYGHESVGRAGMVSASALSRSDFEHVSVERGPITGWAAEGNVGFAVSFRNTPVATTGVFVNGDYFQTLGTPPYQGRLLTAADDAPGAPPAAVIGYHLWRDRFGAAPDAVGQPLLVGDRTYTIVGIAPPKFTGLQPADVAESPLNYTQLWIPLRDADRWPGAPAPRDAWLTTRARLAPGQTAADASPALQAAAARVAAADPVGRRHASLVLSSYGFGPNDSPLDVLIIIALFLAVPLSVLAIGCANVANLQLARATTRARELAVRLAIGASRGQIVRLLTLEALLLSGLSTAAGWAGASVALTMAQDLFPLTLSLDSHVLVFAAALSAGVTLLSGLAPAWLVTRRTTAASLQQSERAGGLAHSRLRHALVVIQIAASLVLLVMCGMFVQSVRAMRASAPLEFSQQLVVPFHLDRLNYTTSQASSFLATVLARVRQDGRVRAVAAENMTGLRYRVVGSPGGSSDTGSERRYTAGGFVTSDWTEASAARLVSGRAFKPDDSNDVAIVSQRLARHLEESGGSVGRTLEIATSAEAPAHLVTIIGVVADVQQRPDVPQPDEALFTLMPATAPPEFVLRVRAGQPMDVAEDLRQIIRGIDERLPWQQVETAEAVYLRDLGPMRYLALSVGGFGLVAMILAAAGLFAVTTYVVSLRTREIGIRVAIGAASADVLKLVLGQGLRLGIYGAVLGLVIALPMAVAMRAVFIGVSPVDPLAVVPPVILVLAVAVVASIIPARRATTIDPVGALRRD